MYRFFVLPFLLLGLNSQAQSLNDNSYRSVKNPYYWQNRKPDAAYWQQDVHYTIDATMDETDHRIDGKQELEYWNNSPDTLYFVYFHLFQNAFIKGSHLHELETNNKVKARLGKKEAEGKGIIIDHISTKDQVLRTELDNTLLKVYLSHPLLPGAKTSFDIQFKTYYDRGATRRRMQMYDAWGFMHYNGVQWFPKVCVYDRKFGWDTYQHLNKEFYADFGSYDVSLNFPSNYVVEATGAIQNRDEVLPKSLREQLDVKNFAKKPWNEAPSVITPYVKGERKTWKFHADNVHDFAFTADPSYRIATSYWNGVECVGLVQEPHASGWQNSAEYVAKIIKTFSEDIGMYAYPKMIAADANDGMEYPMLTLDGGRSPGYNGLLVHEIGHNWFYGMVGSNETYRASMDEGFTQFLTAWGLSRIDGKITPASKSKSWRSHFAEPVDVCDKSVFNAYHYDALNKEEVQLNTHSDDFNSALGHGGGYRLVYYKTASMLYNLQYTLGDSLFSEAMKHYFSQWKIAHPYFEDFKASIIQFTHVDLNWFFDQWFETTKTIDYAVGRIRRVAGADSFSILLRRKGEMQMPVDLTITAKDGKQYDYHIPNTWFTKSTAATPLPKWYGWAKLHPTYKAVVSIPSGIRSVQIDTSNRLVDVNMLNNYKTRGVLPLSCKAFKTKLDGGVANPWDRKHYRLYLRPDLWWNAVDGVKAGVHFEGDYLFSLHKLDATFWWNTHAGQLDKYLVYTNQDWYERYAPFNYSFNYTTPLSLANPKLQIQLNSRFLDGLMYHRGGFNWNSNKDNTIELFAQTMWRPLSYDRDYLLFPREWSSARAMPNSSLNASWTHRYQYMNGNGQYKFSARAPFLTGNNPAAFNYAYLQLEAINSNHFGKFEWRTRFFARYGTGTNIPYESALFAAGASPEEMMENKYTRSTGLFPTEWVGDVSRYNTNHFQYGGGLNLRGYAGYFMADERNGSVLIAYKGRSGASFNTELDFGGYMKLRPKFTRNWLSASMYLFADAGIMELSRYDSIARYWDARPANLFSDVRVDAGLGATLTIRKWGVFDKAKPLTLRFDMPMFLNRPPYANPQYFNLRYVVGISRCF